MRVYGDLGSGNCLKVKWTADHLGLPYTFVPVDIMAGESRAPAFLAKFPFGEVPTIELDDGRTLAQSNAIVRYLARGTPLLPDDPWSQAKIDEWLFWEQYSHEPYIAVCRFHMLYSNQPKETRDPDKVRRGDNALDLMEQQLAAREFFVGGHISIADIALLAYTRVAHEGGFDLGARPHLRTWIARSEVALKPPQTGSGS